MNTEPNTNENEPQTPPLPPVLPQQPQYRQPSFQPVLPSPSVPERFRLTPFAAPPSLGEALGALLKTPGKALHSLVSGENATQLRVSLLILLIGGLLLFGLVVGSFAGGVQWWASPAKIIAGLCIASLISLPSLYIFTCLGGLDLKFSTVCGLLLSSLAVMGILLAGLAPVVWVFSQSTVSLPFMGLLLLALWICSYGVGMRFLVVGARELGITQSGPIYAWLAIFTLVTLQMSCALRPIIGRSDDFLPKEKLFFVEHWGAELEKNAKIVNTNPKK